MQFCKHCFDWCRAVVTPFGGIKGLSSHDPGRFVSNSSVVFTSLSKQASIQIIIQVMNILSVFVLFAILLKCVAASEDALGVSSGGQLIGKTLRVHEKLLELEGSYGFTRRCDQQRELISLSGIFKILVVQRSVYLLHSLIREKRE